ncbi:MAG: DUF3810 domain-containing protein [Oribacterium sp.]|nr:DUF3810 domain-containing protein [Oribacterium sp.]
MFNFHIIKTKTSAAIPSHSQRVYLLVLLLDLLALAANQLAVRSSAFADAYSHYVYRVLSLGIGSVMGLLPFSVVELLLYATILFVLFDFAKQLCRALRVGAACVHSARISQDAQTHLLAAVARPLRRFLGHLFLILSTLLVLYVFLCGINYHRTSFSEEAGLSVTIDAHGTVYDEADLIALCDYLVTEINDTEAQLAATATSDANANVLRAHTSAGADAAGTTTESATATAEASNTDTASASATESPTTTVGASGPSAADETAATTIQVEGVCIGQTSETPKPSAAWLWHAGCTGQRAMEKLGQRYRRLSGHYPYPKPILNTWILSVQQTTGVYSPFTVEANYNRDIAYYDIPFTICHELSHLRGYMQEEEANFIGVLATIGADDLYFNYSGYVSAWVYAGNALARIDSTAFATLYSRINARTRQDMLYNNAYWQQFEGKPAEAHEQLNDAYLKMQGQTSGVRSYGHVTDLMLEYFEKNGTLAQ